MTTLPREDVLELFKYVNGCIHFPLYISQAFKPETLIHFPGLGGAKFDGAKLGLRRFDLEILDEG
jgi:hypothetical protein